ncbi:MAG: hypothetical protein II969_04265 [Anaerolineaceae bacterium]|nr:hypothetical protein [Anaerolineaceae bacterium]
MAEEHRIDYHAGLVAALKTRYDDQYDFMETVKELILGEKPPRLDAVVLKKASDKILSDEIGSFFKENNIFEFKGYGDGLSINDIYKAEGYALFYMVIDRKVNEIPIDTITISILQYRYPMETFKQLKILGCSIIERNKGIYEISGGPIIYPFQVIDAAILGDDWTVLKVLVPGATEEQIAFIQKEYVQAENELYKQHMEDVLRTAFESNKELFRKMKEAGKMSEAVELVFKEEIEEAAEKKEERIVANLLKMNEPVDKIVQASEWSPDKVISFAKKIGITTLIL